MSESHAKDAQTISALVEASAHEAVRKERQPNRVNRLLHELKQSVENFEASHPELVRTVDEFATLLGNMGL